MNLLPRVFVVAALFTAFSHPVQANTNQGAKAQILAGTMHLNHGLHEFHGWFSEE